MDDDGDDKDDSKRKSRNLSEKKRRDQFNALVNDLSALISTSNRKMDKSTVLKSTIAFLKHHNEATDRSKVFEIQQDWKPSFLTNDEFTHLMLESLDGFIIVFSSSGAIFYASESITSLLGYLPTDLLNMSIFDLSYELDHECLLNIFLNPKPVIEPLQTDITSSNQISFFIHLKRGGIDKVDANAYELVKFVGYFRNDVCFDNLPLSTSKKNQHQSQRTPPQIFQADPMKLDQNLIFVGTGRIQTPQLIREMSAIDPSRNEFTSKHSMEWKFLFLDHRAPPIIGYMPFEVLGTSGYDYYHFDDLDSIVACHEELMQKGEGKSCYYRFLTKGQQWIWLQTEFYISYHQFNSKPDYVVCTHKVVSYADVIRQSKSSCRDSQILNISQSTTTSSAKSTTLPLSEYEVVAPNPPPNKTESATPLPTTNSNVDICNISTTSAIITDAPSGRLDISNIWGTGNTTPAVTTQPSLTTQMKSSRPASCYGNISSTGISPSIKRKRYIHTNRGNESDSTSISADSGTSKQSLLTHLSSARQRHCLPLGAQQQNHFIQNQQQSNNFQPQVTPSVTPIAAPFHHSQSHTHLNHQSQAHHNHQSVSINQTQGGPKIVPVISQHPIATTPVVTNNTCQYTQPGFTALRNPQIVTPAFLEPPQYLTAIPVQPVISPFSVAPVLSPITTQPDMLPAAVVMAPTHTQLQEQLQRKHDELQKLILQQQDELRMVSEQLLLARYTLLQPMVPVGNYNNAVPPTSSMSTPIGPQNRTYNFANIHSNSNNNNNNNSNNNLVDNQFSQFDFAMNTDALLNQQDHHTMLQNHQQQQQQQQHLQTQLLSSQQQQHLTNQALQQNNQNHHSSLSPSHQQPQSNPHQSQHQSQQQQQQQQNFLQRNVPDLDQFGQEDIDAFLNLSPLQTIGGSQNVNGLTGNQNVHSPLSQSYVNNSNPGTIVTANDDSLLSYMRMAADSSPVLNFGISDDSDTQSEDTKLIQQPHRADRQQQHQRQQQRQQQQQQQQHQHQHSNSSYFGRNTFQGIGNSQTTTNNTVPNHLPNDLEILPYQMSQAESQNLFNSPPNTTGAQ